MERTSVHFVNAIPHMVDTTMKSVQHSMVDGKKRGITYGVCDGNGGDWVYAGTTVEPGDGLRTMGTVVA